MAAALLLSHVLPRMLYHRHRGARERPNSPYRTDPSSGPASPAGVITLGEGQTAEGMYLSDSRLQVLLSTAWWGALQQLTTSDGWLDEQVSLFNYDLTDVENPELTNTVTVEGALAPSACGQ